MQTLHHNTGNIVIIGAGIGGLTLAAAFGSRGITCEVYEQRPRLSSDGFGLNIQPSAVQALQNLGLGEQLDDLGIRTRAHRYVDHQGVTLFEEPRGVDAGFAAAQLSIRRSDLMQVLFNKANITGKFYFDCKVSVQEIIEKKSIKFGVQENLLVGADGARSVVRQALFPDAVELRPGGMTLWRGLSEMPRLFDGRTMIIANEENGVRLIVYPVSKSHYLNGASLLNWVVLIPKPHEGPADPAARRTEANEFLLAVLKNWRFGWLDLGALVTSSPKLMRTEMADRDPIPRWSKDTCVLLGDAAHAMFPIGANGATQTITDSVTLAAAFDNEVDIKAAIRRYEGLRIPEASRIVLASREMNQRELASCVLSKESRAKELLEVTSRYRSHSRSDI